MLVSMFSAMKMTNPFFFKIKKLLENQGFNLMSQLAVVRDFNLGDNISLILGLP